MHSEAKPPFFSGNLLFSILALSVAFLPFTAIGTLRLNLPCGLAYSEIIPLFVALISPLILWKNREIVKKNVFFLSLGFLALTIIGASLFSGNLNLEKGVIVRSLIIVGYVSVLSIVCTQETKRVFLLKVFIASCALTVTISIGAYIYYIYTDLASNGMNPFVFKGFVPFFGHVLRLTGFNSSASEAGYTAFLGLGALILYFKQSGWKCSGKLSCFYHISGLLFGLSILLTFSYAIVLPVILAGIIVIFNKKTPAVGKVAVAAIVGVMLFAVIWKMHESKKAGPVHQKGLLCSTLDTGHVVVSLKSRNGKFCHPIIRKGKSVSTYTFAKQSAWEIFKKNAVSGTGFEHLTREMAQIFRRSTPFEHGNFYRRPHCEYLNMAAGAGFPGIFAFLILLIGMGVFILKQDINTHNPSLFAAASFGLFIGIVVYGVNAEFFFLPVTWFAQGILAGSFIES